MTTEENSAVEPAEGSAGPDPQDTPGDVLGTPTTAVSGDQAAALSAVEETAEVLQTGQHDS
jgi:hypothetical protein